MYRRLKPARPEVQVEIANQYLDWYIQADDNEELIGNVLEAIIEDYQRNFFSEEMFETICKTIDLLDKDVEGTTDDLDNLFEL